MTIPTSRRGFVRSLLTAFAATPLLSWASKGSDAVPPLLARIEMLDGYLLVDPENRVHRFVTTRADAPHWKYAPSRPEHTLVWEDHPRPDPNRSPYKLECYADGRRYFKAYREDASWTVDVSPSRVDEWHDYRGTSTPMNLTVSVIGSDDPRAQRALAEMMRRAGGRHG